MVSGARKRIAESDSEVSAEACVGGEDKRHKKMETAGDDAAEGSDAAQTAEPQPPKKRNAESDSEVSAEAGVGGQGKRHKKMETAGDGAAAGSEAAQTAEPQPPHKKARRGHKKRSNDMKKWAKKRTGGGGLSEESLSVLQCS